MIVQLSWKEIEYIKANTKEQLAQWHVEEYKAYSTTFVSEVVDKLKQWQRRKHEEDMVYSKVGKKIQEEIDKEILEKLLNKKQ